MAHLLGQLAGSLVMIYLLMRLVLLAFGKHKQAPLSVIIAAGVAYTVVSVASTLGVSGDGPQALALNLVLFLIPALAAVGIELVRVRRLRPRARLVNGDSVSGAHSS